MFTRSNKRKISNSNIDVLSVLYSQEQLGKKWKKKYLDEKDQLEKEREEYNFSLLSVLYPQEQLDKENSELIEKNSSLSCVIKKYKLSLIKEEDKYNKLEKIYISSLSTNHDIIEKKDELINEYNNLLQQSKAKNLLRTKELIENNSSLSCEIEKLKPVNNIINSHWENIKNGVETGSMMCRGYHCSPHKMNIRCFQKNKRLVLLPFCINCVVVKKNDRVPSLERKLMGRLLTNSKLPISVDKTVCYTCLIEKDSTLYCFDESSRNGLSLVCIDCSKNVSNEKSNRLYYDKYQEMYDLVKNF
jgi:hypothetical protein